MNLKYHSSSFTPRLGIIVYLEVIFVFEVGFHRKQSRDTVKR